MSMLLMDMARLRVIIVEKDTGTKRIIVSMPCMIFIY